MPTYVYKFVDSGETIEVHQAFQDDTLTEVAHPESGELLAVKKVFTPVGVTFKGSGFFKTDNRGKKSATSSNDHGSKDHGSKDSGSKDSGSKDSGSSGSDSSSSKTSDSSSSSSSSSSDSSTSKKSDTKKSDTKSTSSSSNSSPTS